MVCTGVWFTLCDFVVFVGVLCMIVFGGGVSPILFVYEMLWL